MKNWKEHLAIAFFLGGILLLFGHCTGCAHLLERAPAAVNTAKYERDLDDCLQQAHKVDAGRFAFYESCANRVDKAHAKDGGQ